jgi:hypothetical protein
MSTDWRAWVHIMASAHGQWLPGDPRGFRSRDGRIHSSGDYKEPPPPEEHAGLHYYARSTSAKPTTFPAEVRRALVDALVEKLARMDIPSRIIAVNETHAHGLIRVGEEDAVAVFGRAKQLASHRVRDRLPGTIWGEGSHPVRIRDFGHYRHVVQYIWEHHLDGGEVWEDPAVDPR